MSSNLEATPLRDSGLAFSVLGMDSRPSQFSSLGTKPGAEGGSVPVPGAAPDRVISIPVRDRDLQDSFQQPPVAMRALSDKATRQTYVPEADRIREAAIEGRVFGAGYMPTYKADKPPQGIQVLRPILNVPFRPADDNMTMQPWTGPYNPLTEMQQFNVSDPSYQPPNLPPLGGDNGIRTDISEVPRGGYGMYGAPSANR